MTKEENLNNALLGCFLGNLKFFESYDKKLFERISHLTNEIGQGGYKERFALEFIDEIGDFDIFDKQNNIYIYKKNAKKNTSKLLAKTKFNLDNTIALLNPFYYEQNNVDLSGQEFDNIFALDNAKLISTVNQFTKILKCDLKDKNQKIKKIDKFMFIGTILGRHIPKILAQTRAKDFFVCEINLEIFRLSCFVCDYSLLAREGRSVVFSIMEDEAEFTASFSRFIIHNSDEASFLKYISTNYDVDTLFAQITNSVMDDDPYIYNFNSQLYHTFERHISLLEKQKFINFSKLKELNTLRQKPTMLIGAGPSLGKNIAWLEKNQDKFIIVAMAASIKKLTQNNIKIDIVISLDGQNFVFDNHFKDSLDAIKNTIKLISSNSDNNIFKEFKNDKLCFAFEGFSSVLENNTQASGRSVGEVSMQILLLLKFENIYLLGTDLALDQETGQTHDSGYNEVKYNLKNQDNSEVKDTFSLRGELVTIKGNFLDEVLTTRLFQISLKNYVTLINIFRQEKTKIYNLNEQGAFMEGVIPFKIRDLKLENLNKLDKSEENKNYNAILKNIFKKISITTLSKKEKEGFKEELVKLESILKFLRSFESQNFKDEEDFFILQKEFAPMLSKAITYSYLPNICMGYNCIIQRYIRFYFMQKDIKFNQKLLNEVVALWSRQLCYIIEFYIKTIKNQDFLD